MRAVCWGKNMSKSNYQRRDFLRIAATGCACCFAGGIAGAAEKAKGASGGQWSYTGNTGPEHWGDLAAEYRVCGLGMEQSPINLAGGMEGEPGSLEIDYRPIEIEVTNNGHTIQANTGAGCKLKLSGKTYDLLQFHFHHPSEHLLDGKAFDMEVHFVHKAEDGALAVLGVFFAPGARNSNLAQVFDQMPASKGEKVSVGRNLNPQVFIPDDRSFFRYMGSLTTPPCLEGLTWTVFRNPITASADQVQAFASLFPNNARPAQPVNRRFLIEKINKATFSEYTP